MYVLRVPWILVNWSLWFGFINHWVIITSAAAYILSVESLHVCVTSFVNICQLIVDWLMTYWYFTWLCKSTFINHWIIITSVGAYILAVESLHVCFMRFCEHLSTNCRLINDLLIFCAIMKIFFMCIANICQLIAELLMTCNLYCTWLWKWRQDRMKLEIRIYLLQLVRSKCTPLFFLFFEEAELRGNLIYIYIFLTFAFLLCLFLFI